MYAKRFVAFLGIVVILFGVITWTSPSLVKGVKLGLDLKGGFEVLYEAKTFEEGEKVTPELLRETQRSLQKRINSTGVAEPDITTEGTNRIRVKLAGVQNEEEVRKMLAKPVRLTFRGADGKVELEGKDFKRGGAHVVRNELNQPIVSIELNSADHFYEVTSRLAKLPEGQNYLAIFLDEDELSRPRVESGIPGGQATITGSYTLQEATDLASLINLGALPLELTEIYTTSIGATLGMSSLNDTVKAGIVGSLLVLIFLVVIYRLPGIVAAICVITYTWLLILVFNLFNVTLTLPGIAAFVLGIGMAVDANIITYERVKEEMRSGKSVLSALKAGSKNSLRTIMDANITSIIANIVIYAIGDGAIRGFALTMILSILVSIITNIFFSRFLVTLIIRSNVFKKPAYYGVKESEIREL